AKRSRRDLTPHLPFSSALMTRHGKRGENPPPAPALSASGHFRLRGRPHGRRRALVLLRSPEERDPVEHLLLEILHVEVDHGRHEEREELRDEEPAYDDEAEGTPARAVRPDAERDRERAEDGRERRHEDGPEAVHGRVVDRLHRVLAVVHAVAREI